MMKTQFDEAADLLETLFDTLKIIAMSDELDRQRIANARHDAACLVATIAKEEGSARSRIVACFERFAAYKEAGDVNAAGWMLMAIEERIAERDLPGWRKLRTLANMAARALPRPEKTALH